MKSMLIIMRINLIIIFKFLKVIFHIHDYQIKNTEHLSVHYRKVTHKCSKCCSEFQDEMHIDHIDSYHTNIV